MGNVFEFGCAGAAGALHMNCFDGIEDLKGIGGFLIRIENKQHGILEKGLICPIRRHLKNLQDTADGFIGRTIIAPIILDPAIRKG